jgi:hypothetical protein
VADWVQWHQPYDDPTSSLSLRLRLVQAHLRDAIGCVPAGRGVRIVSACAGQGRDVIGVVAALPAPARERVSARLVENDPALLARARQDARELPGIEVVDGDAGLSTAYAAAVPADVVLLCGVFGNVSDTDVRRTIIESRRLCAPEATVIWTRHRKAPDLTPSIDQWFEESGFAAVGHNAPADSYVGVGVHRLTADPLPFLADRRMFTFIGDGTALPVDDDASTGPAGR